MVWYRGDPVDCINAFCMKSCHACVEWDVVMIFGLSGIPDMQDAPLMVNKNELKMSPCRCMWVAQAKGKQYPFKIGVLFSVVHQRSR